MSKKSEINGDNIEDEWIRWKTGYIWANDEDFSNKSQCFFYSTLDENAKWSRARMQSETEHEQHAGVGVQQRGENAAEHSEWLYNVMTGR